MGEKLHSRDALHRKCSDAKFLQEPPSVNIVIKTTKTTTVATSATTSATTTTTTTTTSATTTTTNKHTVTTKHKSTAQHNTTQHKRKRTQSTGFDSYFVRLKPHNNNRNPWFIEFWEQHFACLFASNSSYYTNYTSYISYTGSNSDNDNNNNNIDERLPRRTCTGNVFGLVRGRFYSLLLLLFLCVLIMIVVVVVVVASN